MGQATTASRAPEQQGRSSSGWRVPPARRRVSLPWVVLGLLLTIGLGLAGVVVIDQVDQRQPVLAVARPVAVGQPITELDLTTVLVGAEPEVAVLPADEAASVVGRPAAIPLTPGMLLVPGAVGPPAGLASGEALVAVALEAGRYPPELAAGATVQVVEVSSADQAAGGQAALGRVLVGQAQVLQVHAQPDQPGQASVVTLKLGLAAAEPVASAAAASRVALVLLAPDGSA